MMKAYLLERGVHANKFGKGALLRHYEEMVEYCSTGKVPLRLIANEEECL